MLTILGFIVLFWCLLWNIYSAMLLSGFCFSSKPYALVCSCHLWCNCGNSQEFTCSYNAKTLQREIFIGEPIKLRFTKNKKTCIYSLNGFFSGHIIYRLKFDSFSVPTNDDKFVIQLAIHLAEIINWSTLWFSFFPHFSGTSFVGLDGSTHPAPRITSQGSLTHYATPYLIKGLQED